MSLTECLFSSLSLDEFKRDYWTQRLLSGTQKRSPYLKLINWDLLDEIFRSGHRDCWLAMFGQLPAAGQPGANGQLNLDQAFAGFASGYTVLIRHSEIAHPRLRKIADEFAEAFRAPINIHLYATPATRQGFDWHYDIEDVFILQSAGAKEFYLRESVFTSRPSKQISPKTTGELEKYCRGSQIACRLEPGDWLYIPAGWWHKAVAERDSFHLSVGVSRPE